MTQRERVQLLDGSDWSCKGYLGEEWLMRRATEATSNDVHGWVPARVPGSVLDDLVRAGLAPDPKVDLGSLACEWVKERTWVYRRVFEVETPGDRAYLEFDGIDHAAQLFVNGRWVGDHEGAFTTARVDVTSALREGTNLLAVAIAPAPDTQTHFGRSDLVRVLKSRVTYGWDFCPRVVHLGIWDRVRLVFPAGVEIDDLVARPQVDPDDLGRASVTWEAVVASRQRGSGRLSVELVREGVAVARRDLDVDLGGRCTVAGTLEVEQPELWWPNGHGDQPLYELHVRLATDGAEAARSTVTAFHRVELAANEGAPSDARGYTFVVNGRRIHLRGWNWVPMDIHHGIEDHDLLDHLLGLAARAGTNLLRVWGGGLIERSAFYERCDRLGLMVWQEFPLSSSLHGSVPCDDPAFVEAATEEARGMVVRRRNHPSLVLWCGGNELDDTPGRPSEGHHPLIAALGEVVAELDPDAAWLPTSPTGPTATFTLGAVEADPDGQHDVHGPWEHQGLVEHHELYAHATSLFHTEFGVEGMANVATIEAYVSPEHRMPADRSNPHTVHRGDFWINTPLLEGIFGPTDDLADLVAASQLLQADGLRAAIESNRRRQWRQSGSIPWQLNEPFPNVFCTSAVDHAGRPKAAYYAVAEAYRSLAVTMALPTQAFGDRDQVSAGVWASATDEGLRGATVEVSMRDAAGTYVHRTEQLADVPCAASVHVTDVAWPRPDRLELFWLEARLVDAAGEDRSTTRWLCSGGHDLRALRALPPARLAAALTDDGTLEVRNEGDGVAVGVRAHDGRPIGAPGHVWFGSGNVTLFPGEHATIATGVTGDVERPHVVVDAFNAEARTVA